MSRPRSDEKRTAILEAATRIIVLQGLGAPTAGIAKEAGVANGSLFTYFETKTELFNHLYLAIKSEMAAAILNNYPAGAESRDEFFHVWRNWMDWALANPHKRKALAQLGVSDEIAAETRMAGHTMMMPIVEMLERARARGAMQTAPKGFVVALMNSVAEATIDFMAQDPEHAKKHSALGFDALWRMLS
jgi:AcrR family transcriptional regulator